MKGKILLTLLLCLTVAGFSLAQVPADQDTIFIDGGTMLGGENAGLFETTINGDVDGGTGDRINPNRVYALYQGQVYYQQAPLDVNNPTGTLTIVGVPDPNNPSANTKPIILIYGIGGNPVVINGGGTNQVYGSIKLVNIQYQAQQLDGTQNNELFYCGTADKRKQTLTIDNCLFEFGNIDLFDCTNESGAIGGWPNGASFFITNTYFRNMFYNGQWWDSRVFQCKHPTDTLWIENCTVTTGGLTFLQQNQLTDFMYINHNTIINNKKYWLLSPYRHEMFITNNIFVNQNWVGEDTNVTNSGQDPDGLFMSTVNIDTNNATNGLIVQDKYYDGDSTHFTSDLDFENMKIYISNNINYYSPLLVSNYYQSSDYILTPPGTIPSYLDWFGWGSGPWAVRNTPGMWMNSRTQALFDQYSPENGGGFVEENTITDDPQTTTSVNLDGAEVTAMAEWNQTQWGDSRFSDLTTILSTGYIYGDYSPTTVPGIDNGTKTEVGGEGAGIQVGITKFTDLTENFSQTAHMSTLDNLPIGAVMWDDAISYDPAAAFQAVMNGYTAATDVETTIPGIPDKFSLSQNYPNPFNPTTQIEFSIPLSGNVTLKVFNLLGEEVATLVNEDLASGNYKVDFNAADLSSGLYIYQIHAGTFTSSKKMMLLK